MFDANKARRQRMKARMSEWRSWGGMQWARLRRQEAQAKLAWNKRERAWRARHA